MAPSQSPIISPHYNHLRGHRGIVGHGHHHPQNGSAGSSPASRHLAHNGHSPSLGGMTSDSGHSGSSKIKCVFLGDGAVGKTSLLLRFSDDIFSTNPLSTIGVDFKIKTLKVDDKLIKIQIWDTAG